MERERVTVDRVIDGVAVCAAGPGALKRIPVEQLPDGVDEGCVLELVDGVWTVNDELTRQQGAYVEGELHYEHEDGSPAMREDAGMPW